MKMKLENIAILPFSLSKPVKKRSAKNWLISAKRMRLFSEGKIETCLEGRIVSFRSTINTAHSRVCTAVVSTSGSRALDSGIQSYFKKYYFLWHCSAKWQLCSHPILDPRSVCSCCLWAVTCWDVFRLGAQGKFHHLVITDEF